MIDVEIISVESDDFSPVEAYGYDKYETGSYLNRLNGISRDELRFRGSNRFFTDMLESDRLANYRLRSRMREIDYLPDDTEGRIEDYRHYSQFRNISQANHLNFLSYAPIQKLVKEDKISAWGHTAESLPMEDIIGRRISNGFSDVADDGTVVKKMYRYSDDPDYSREQLWKMQKQRDLIDWCLEDTDLDPTDITRERF